MATGKRGIHRRRCPREAQPRQPHPFDHASVGWHAQERGLEESRANAPYAFHRRMVAAHVASEIRAQGGVVRDAASEILFDVTGDVRQLRHLANLHRPLVLLRGERRLPAAVELEEANSEYHRIAEDV